MNEPQRPTEERAGREEPNVSGTVFLTVLLLMLIAGIWLIMYFQLLSR
ncbi:MAG: cytochrome c oxidase subunit 2A [Gemmatimonadota bacterium]|nr:cytochrome c oxidase subunit 2A [Gemmatimonadota bacterium]